ncbi:MAG: hypothetical protein WBD00_03830 [Candidatus Omnitrophota bacterium]
MRSIRCILVVLVMLASLAVSALAESVTGTWESVEYYRNGKSLPEMAGKARYEFKEDGTYTHKMGHWLTAKGTYLEEESKILLTSDVAGKTDVRLEDDRIIVENSRTKLKIIYVKSE